MDNNNEIKNSGLFLFFNSKLFIYLDMKEENFDNNEEIENPSQNDLSQFLLRDLIDELSLTNIENSHINKDITFQKQEIDYNYDNKNNYYNFNRYNQNHRIKTYNNIKKNDWICIYCNNLNYSFRNKCNRCNSPREISDLNLIQFLENNICYS